MKKQTVEFKIGDETLRGSLFIPEGKGPFPGVVFYHGRGSTRKNYLPMAENLTQNGIMALAFDFRGCGESDGEFKDKTNRMGIEDAKAGLQFLLTQNIDKERIGIQGTSFGAYVTGMLLNDPQFQFIKSIVLRVPAALSDDQLDFSLSIEEEENFFAKRENWANASSYNGFAQFKGNLLVIRSKNDQLLPEESVNKYYDVAINVKKRKLYVQKNVGHTLSDNPEGRKEFNELTVNWFLETL
jgi:dipeptidyl aminopeptidase/acylaminoacyl peptidase